MSAVRWITVFVFLGGCVAGAIGQFRAGDTNQSLSLWYSLASVTAGVLALVVLSQVPFWMIAAVVLRVIWIATGLICAVFACLVFFDTGAGQMAIVWFVIAAGTFLAACLFYTAESTIKHRHA